MRLHAKKGPRNTLRAIAATNTRLFQLRSQVGELLETRKGLKQEAFLQAQFLDRLPIGLLRLDPRGRIRQLNRHATRLLGGTINALAGRYLSSLLELADRAKFRDHLRRCHETSTVVVTELRFRHPKHRRTLQCQCVAFRDTRKKVVEIAATLLDVTAQSRAQSHLRESEANLGALMEALPHPVQLLDAQGRWLYANRAALEMFGLARLPYHQKTDFELVHAAFYQETLEGRQQRHQAALQSGAICRNDELLPKPDGTLRVLDTIRVPLLGSAGKPSLIVIGYDLTERKANEDAVRQSEHRLRLILDSALDAVISTNAQGLIIGWNPQAEKMFGWSEADALGRKLVETTIPPARRDTYAKEMREYLKLAAKSVLKKSVETTALHADGHIFPVEIAVTSATAEGEIILTAFIRDITQRKAAEHRLVAQFAIARVLATSPQLDDAIPRLLKTIAEQLGFHFGAFWTRAQQTNSVHCQNVWCDQPSKYKAFEHNSRNEARARRPNLPGCAWASGKPVWITDLGEDQNFARAARASAAGFHSGFGFPIVCHDKFVGVMEFFSRDPREPDEVFLGAVPAIADQIGQFIERQRTNEALRESEARFRTMAEAAPVMIWMAGPDALCTYVNRTWLEFTGHTLEQDLADGWAGGLHPDDAMEFLHAYRRSFDARESFEFTYRLQRNDGEYRWILDRGVPRFSPGGEFAGYIGSCLDITEIRQAEAMLSLARDQLADANAELDRRVRERTKQLSQTSAALEAESLARTQSERMRLQLAAIVESSSDAIVSRDLDGKITTWNKAAAEMFGWAAREMLGQPYEILVPPEQRAAVESHTDLLKRGETVQSFEAQRCCKNGGIVELSISTSPIKDARGNILGVASIMRDLSERKELQSEIIRISEHEQTRIAQDLHDGLGQELVGIFCLSDVLKKNLADQSSPVTGDAARISRLLHSAVAQTRSLARGLLPVAQEPGGLMAALAELAAKLTHIFKVECILECPEPVQIENPDVAANLYRIAQEAATNAVKHGRARKIIITLSSVPEKTTLAVQDDGTGLQPTSGRSPGLGLRIMNHRANAIGGMLIVQKSQAGGTEVICTLDQPQHQHNNGKPENGH